MKNKSGINNLYRLFIFLLILLFTQHQQTFAQTISLPDTRITLKAAFAEIEKQTEMSVDYNREVIDVNKMVSIRTKNGSLSDIMTVLLQGTGCIYTIKENHIVISTTAVKQQGAKTITGVIIDETGEPVIGANVIEKGTTANGTITDMDGKFNLQVAENTTLQISYIGYLNQDVPVKNQTSLQIVLKEDLQTLEEVVVIGYGSVKKQNLTSSVSKIDNKALQERPITNVGEAFQGQLAGVRAQSSSGIPGQDLVIRIRGINSINGDSSPLYVIDGVPRDNMSDLNPSDIASIQLLKDAAASSIYGARGGNGAIVIETKQGSGKPTVALDAYYGLQNSEKALNMMNKEEWITYNAFRRNVAWLERGGSMSDPMEMRPADQQIPNEWFNVRGTDWQDAITQTAPMQSYQLSVSGKNDLGSIFLSGGYFDQDGVVKYTYFKRFNFRLNAIVNISKNIRVGINLAPSFSNQDKRDSEGKELVSHRSLLISPLIGLDQATKEWGYPVGFGATYPNPLEQLKYTTDRTKNNRIFTTAWGEIDLYEGLRFRTQYSYNSDINNYEYFQPENISNAEITRGNSESTTLNGWVIQNTITYDRNFKTDHHINLLAGQSAEESGSYKISATATDWPYENLETLNLAKTPTKAQTERKKYTTASFFGRATYEYKDKYLMTASLRYDGSSRFGKNNKWGAFPSFSAGWKINEESFMNQLNWLSLLKLRASWGTSGNDRIGYYDYMAKLGTANTSWAGSVVAGAAPGNIENPNLQWESTKTTNLGFDFSGFKNRVQVNFDYYINTTDHLLFNVPVTYTTGFSSYRTNLGSVENKGWEIDLTTHNITGTFNWSTSLNLSANKNKVLDMGDITRTISSNYDAQFITKVGSPISTFYTYRTNGVLTNDDFMLDDKGNPVSAKVPIMEGQRPGSIRFVDQPTEANPNGDGIINSDDLAPYGNNLPDLMYGFSNRFSWKNFELNVLLQGQIGGDVLFLMQRQADVGAENLNQTSKWLRQWKPDYEVLYGGRGNPIPDYYDIDMSWDGKTYSVIGTSTNNTDLRIYDATFLRIKNITLSYTIPKTLLERIKIKGIKVYFSADNLKTFTSYPGANPETNTGGNNNTQMGVDYSTYPVSKRYTLGANITF